MQTLLSVGSVVLATVTRVEVYGIYLTYEGSDILVLIPEVSWIPLVHSCQDFTRVGEEHLVKITHHDPDKRLNMGSIKQTNPDGDPWIAASSFAAGDVFDGVVHMALHGKDKAVTVSYMVRIAEGICGHLMKPRPDCDLKVGDRIRVEVKSIDVCGQKIEVELVSE